MMSRRIGVMSTIWQNLRNSLSAPRQKVTFVGDDHLGNRYYEKAADPAKNLKGARWIEARDADQFTVPTLPVEWEAWLRGKRNNPPTQEELDMNYALMVRTRQRAKELEQKELQSRGSHVDGESQSESSIPIDTSTPADEKLKTQFPVYEDFEAIPGEKNSPRHTR